MPIDRVRASNATAYEIYIQRGHVMIGTIDPQIGEHPAVVVHGKLTKEQAVAFAAKVLEAAVSLQAPAESANPKEPAKMAAAPTPAT